MRYVQRTRQLGAPDLVILPGTKNTMDDLRWLRESGLEAAVLRLSAAGTPVLGVCGGYQMLGEELCDPAGEESGTPCTLRGLGLLPTTTVFGTEKHLTQTTARAAAAPFAGAALTGYEIHAGRTEVRGSAFCKMCIRDRPRALCSGPPAPATILPPCRCGMPSVPPGWKSTAKRCV